MGSACCLQCQIKWVKASPCGLNVTATPSLKKTPPLITFLFPSSAYVIFQDQEARKTTISWWELKVLTPPPGSNNFPGISKSPITRTDTMTNESSLAKSVGTIQLSCPVFFPCIILGRLSGPWRQNLDRRSAVLSNARDTEVNPLSPSLHTVGVFGISGQI